MRTRSILALAAALLLAPLAADAASPHAARFPLISWKWLRAPFAWLAQSEPRRELPCEAPECHELLSATGFQRVVFDAPGWGTGLFVEVTGSVQFRSAEVFFAGDDVSRLDLQYAIRSDGIFELRDFRGERAVSGVVMLVRAASPRATLRVRLGQAIE
jgi:hypothetical protein